MTQESYPWDGIDWLGSQWGRLARYLDDTGVHTDPAGVSPKVSANSSGMQVFLSPGEAIVRGEHYRNLASLPIVIAANATGSPRIDTVVLKLDPVAKTVLAVVHAGTSGGPAPTLTQTDEDVYEMPLANVTVDAGAVTIAAGKVADTRPLSGLRVRPCVFVADLGPVRFGTIAAEFSSQTIQWFDGTIWHGFGHATDADHAAAADHATSADTATVATLILNLQNNMQFRYEDIGGQPTYVWGSTANDIARVWAVRNFTVAHADSADSAGIATNLSGGDVAGRNVNASGILSVLGFNCGFVAPGVIQAPQSVRDRIIAGRTVLVAGDATLGSASSSLRYKRDVAPLAVDLDALRRIVPSTFRYDPDAENVADDGEATLAGFIAENVAEHYPLGAVLDEQGRPDDVSDRALLAAAYLRISDLETRLLALEERSPR